MKQQNILLLTDIFPSNNYSGGIVNQQLCYFLLEENCKIYCANIKSSKINPLSDSFIKNHIIELEYEKPRENSDDEKKYQDNLKFIVTKLSAQIRKHHINIIWCPIQGESILRIYHSLQKKFGNKLRFVAEIWDPIEWALYELHYNHSKTHTILNLFDQAMHNSDFILTASYQMNKKFKQKYKVPCKTIFSSYRPTTYYPPAIHHDKKTFTILLAGQAYAQKGIQSLITALQSMNWQYRGKEIFFKYFSSLYDNPIINDPHIIIESPVAQDLLIEHEKQADLLYCPYYFDDIPAYKQVSINSYPSKITTYIPSHTPILIHSRSDSTVYCDFKKYNCGFLLDSLDNDIIVKFIKHVIDTKPDEITKLTQNADKLFERFFTRERNKKIFLKALNIPYNYNQPSYHILEVNNLDLPGKRWNGYDLTEYTNQHTHNLASQIVTYKTSDNDDVFKIYTPSELQLEHKLLEFEANKLSVHSCLSCSSPNLLEKDLYQNADVVHFHLIHNMKLSLISLIELCNKKPSVITIHDPWIFTGRCVWLYDCKKYLSGCHNCPNLNNLFPLKCDNCHELWSLKKFVYDKLDVDYVVTTKYMYDLFKESPLTKGKRLHVIPFGININEFYQRVSQKEAKKHYHIPNDNIVIFHRAQFLSKGTEYVIEALKELKTDQKISIITCSEKGRLDSIKNKFNVIDLGDITSEELVYAYNACDFFLSPSIGESFCMMAVEAMSCAKPVVIFNNTALPSVTFAPECGVMAKDRDSHDLMEKIKWLIENKEERLKRGELARKIVCKNYDIDIYNQRIQNLYAEVATRKHHYINYEALLSQRPKDTPSVLALKKLLNSLTRSIFPKKAPEQQSMLYNIPKQKSLKSIHIKYSDPNTQVLINQYNNKLYEALKTFDPYKLYGSLPYKITHKIGTLFKLITKDRQHLATVIHEKIHGKK